MDYVKSYVEQYLKKIVRPRRPDIEVLLLEAFDAKESDTAPTALMVAALMEAASEKSAPIYEVSTEFLGCFAERNDEALQAILNMADSRQAHVRHNALLCLRSRTPVKICIQVIRKGLKDKSSRVRSKAADWVVRFMHQQIPTDLSEALKRELSDDLNHALKNEANRETYNEMCGALKALGDH